MSFERCHDLVITSTNLETQKESNESFIYGIKPYSSS